MYKVTGKIWKPTPAMKAVLAEMKAGAKLTSFYPRMRATGCSGKKRETFRLNRREIPASTVKGLVDRYLIRETNHKEEVGYGYINYRSEYVLLPQQSAKPVKPVNKGVEK